jgi:hypothetical protein
MSHTSAAIIAIACFVASFEAHAQGGGYWSTASTTGLRSAHQVLREKRRCAQESGNGGMTCRFVIDSGFAFDLRYVGTGAATLDLTHYERSRTTLEVSLMSRSSRCLQVRPQGNFGMFYRQAGASMDPAYLSITTGNVHRTLALCDAESPTPRR